MATLKISDLSVGDWVEYETMPTKVMNINGFDSVVRGKASNGNIVIAHIDCFKPIPITTEILEKNGFESISQLSIMYRYRTDITVAEYYSGLWGFGIGVPCNDLAALHGVHTLQHAMRLAGAEKEINL